jgi:hypothetical protein
MLCHALPNHAMLHHALPFLARLLHALPIPALKLMNVFVFHICNLKRMIDAGGSVDYKRQHRSFHDVLVIHPMHKHLCEAVVQHSECLCIIYVV